MMTFSSSSDLSRLHKTDPAHPVISALTSNLFTDNDPVTIALMQPGDVDHPLTEMFDAKDVTLEGVVEQGGMYIVAIQTDYDYGLAIVIPDEDWLGDDLRRCIESNLQH